MPPTDPAPPARTELLKGLITAFTAFHLLMVVPWLLPVGPFERLIPLSGVYLRAIGLQQAWFMFSKGPAGSEHMVLRVVRPGGAEQRVELPPVVQMGHLQAWVDYRYRELEDRILDGLPLSIGDMGPVYEAVARWGAEQAGGPVVAVHIDRCGLPAPSIEEARAAGRDFDWTAHLRDPSTWPCATVRTVTLDAGGAP